MKYNEAPSPSASSTSSRTELIQKYHQQLVSGIERIKGHLATPGLPMDKLSFLSKKQAELEGQLLLFRNKYMMIKQGSTSVEQQQQQTETTPNNTAQPQPPPQPSPSPPHVNRMMPLTSTFPSYSLPSYAGQQPPSLSFPFAPQSFGLGHLSMPPPPATLSHHPQMRIIPTTSALSAPSQQQPMYGAFSSNVPQTFFYSPQTASPMLNNYIPQSLYQRPSPLIGNQSLPPPIGAPHIATGTSVSPPASQEIPQFSPSQQQPTTTLSNLPSPQQTSTALDCKVIPTKPASPAPFMATSPPPFSSTSQSRPPSPPTQLVRRSALTNRPSKSISQFLDEVLEKASGLQNFKWLSQYESISLKDDGALEELSYYLYLYLQLVVVTACISAKTTGKKAISSEDIFSSEMNVAKSLPSFPLDVKTFPPRKIQKHCHLLASKLTPSLVSSSTISNLKRTFGKILKKAKSEPATGHKSETQSDSSLSHEEGCQKQA